MRKFRRRVAEVVHAIEVTPELLVTKRENDLETEVHVADDESYTLLIYRNFCVEVRTETCKSYAEMWDWLIFEPDGKIRAMKPKQFYKEYGEIKTHVRV